jgi:hypothetical protein
MAENQLIAVGVANVAAIKSWHALTWFAFIGKA